MDPGLLSEADKKAESMIEQETYRELVLKSRETTTTHGVTERDSSMQVGSYLPTEQDLNTVLRGSPVMSSDFLPDLKNTSTVYLSDHT
jgi:hypothetical protein